MLDEQQQAALFGAVVAKLAEPEGEFISARSLYTAGLSAGLDMIGADPERRAATLRAMMNSYRKLPPPARLPALKSMIAALAGSGEANAAGVNKLLSPFGYEWDKNSFVPVGLLDQRERSFLPLRSADDLGKAIERLSRGDESGAISAACGAVDLATEVAYERLGLGNPGRVSFSAKVNTALAAANVFDQMFDEFRAIGMDEGEARETAEYLRRIMNDAGQVLQILRKRMGDVHGSRPALRSTAYDSIKLASAICALFEPHQ